MPSVLDLALRAGDLRRLAADHDEPRIRPRAHDDGHRAVEQVQPLIVLERSRVENDGRVCREPEPLANRVATTRGRDVARPGRVFDQHGRHVGVQGADGRLEVLANHDDDPRATNHELLEPAQHPREPRRLRVAEVADLLRQARVHVVEMRHAEPPGQDDADDAAFFVRVDDVVLAREREARGRQGQRQVEGDLGPRRADAHVLDERRPQAATNRQTAHLDVASERVGHQIDGMTQRDERPDAMKFGEGRAPGLEERLRCDHQDVHAGWPPNRAGGVTKPTCYTTPRLVRPVSGHC